jgi:anti-sigma factor RsiW
MKDDPTLVNAEADLHAFVDGRLGPAERAAVQARLQADPAAAARVVAWTQQRDALRALHSDLLREPIPPSLLQAAQQLDRRSNSVGQWQRWGGVAASVTLAFVLGWSAKGQWGGNDGGAPSSGPQVARHFAEQAAVAHAVYQPEVRHPVEVGAAQQEHLVQWLSKRVGRPLKVPVLSAQGWELVGGRLLPGDQGARAQFMYQNSAGQRLTLYLGALNGGQGEAGQETSFRFLADGPVPGFYWVDRGFGYAIAGQLPRPALQEIATVVYRQLGGA